MMPLPQNPALSVVIPVFNERATIEEILRRVLEVRIEKEIIIVDDFSTDGTRDLLSQFTSSTGAVDAGASGLSTSSGDTIRVFFQDRNFGKGAALRRGFREASGEIVLVQDADLEYDPQDYHALLAPFERGADVVYGTRFSSGTHRVLFFWHAVGNRFLTTCSNMFTNLNLSDVWTCYKAFRRQVLERISLEEDRFGFEPEITAKVARAGCVIFEVPISYYGRTYAQGKKITWKDGVHALWCIAKYNLFAGGG